MSYIEFIQARYYTKASRVTSPVICLHRMENADKPGTAHAVGSWFASLNSPVASTHYGVDPSTVVQYVLEHDVAYGAPGMNRYGIHIEHAGWSAQNDWTSENGAAMLKLSAELVADICSRNWIPLHWLTDDEIRAANRGDSTARGFCTHADVTRALHTYSGHTDPGPAFPRDTYLQLVSSYLLRV